MARPTTNFDDVLINNDLTVNGNLIIEGDFTLGDTTADDMTLAGQLIFERGANDLTLDSATPGQATTITIPDPGASSADVVLTVGTQTITGVKTMSGANVITHAPTGLKLQDSNASHVVTIAAGDESADRTLSIPVMGGTKTIDLIDLAQTISAVKTYSAQPIFKAGVTNADGVRFDGATDDAVVVAADQASLRIYTIPAAGADAAFLMTEGAQSIAGAKTFAGSALKLGGAGAGVATFLYANDADSRAYTFPDAGNDASVVMLIAGQAVAGTLTRADLTEEPLVVHSVSLHDVKELTGLQLAATPSAGKFGLTQAGSFATPSGVVLTGETANSNTKTDYCTFLVEVPNSYIAGQSLNLQITQEIAGAGSTPTVAAASTIDAKVYRLAGDGSIGTDLCTTAAQALTEAPTVRTFALNNTDLVPGDVLSVWLEMAVTEGAAADANGVINKIALAFDIKG